MDIYTVEQAVYEALCVPPFTVSGVNVNLIGENNEILETLRVSTDKGVSCHTILYSVINRPPQKTIYKWTSKPVVLAPGFRYRDRDREKSTAWDTMAGGVDYPILWKSSTRNTYVAVDILQKTRSIQCVVNRGSASRATPSKAGGGKGQDDDTMEPGGVAPGGGRWSPAATPLPTSGGRRSMRSN